MPERERATRILLVEDQALIALVEKQMLERAGYSVEIVTTGEESVRKAGTDPGLQLVLMDIDLGPGMDGTAAARAILAIRDIPIVFLSSHTEPEYVARVHEITGYGYVVKNSGEFVLLQSIEMALKLHRAHRTSEAEALRYRLITENIRETVLTVDNEFNVTYVSPSIERLTGFTPEEYRKLPLSDVVTDRSTGRLEAVMARQREDPSFTVDQLEIERVRKDGGSVWTDTSIRPLRDANGTVYGHVATIRDISQRKSQRSALEKTEARYRAVVENTADALIVHDFAGTITFVNEQASSMFGYAREDFVGMNVLALCSDGSRERVRALIDRGEWQNRMISEDELLRGNGSVFAAEVSAVVTSREAPGEVQAFVRDTGRRDSSALAFNRLYDQTDEAISVFDRDGRVLQANRASAAAVGRTPSEARGLYLSELHARPFADAALAGIREVYDTGRSRTGEWHTLIQGEDRWFRVHTEPVFDEGGKVASVTTFSTDITDLKRDQENYRLIAEQAHDVVAVFDDELRMLYVSPSIERISGFAPEELLRSTMLSLVHDDDVQGLREAIAEIIAHRRRQGMREYRVRAKDGTYRWVEATATFLYQENGALDRMIIAVRDATERKRAEDQRVRVNARLEAVLDALPEMFFELDADRRFCDYRIPAGIVPYTDPDASMGRRIDEVLPPDLAARMHQAADAALADRSPRHLDYTLTPESGPTRSYRASIAVRGPREAPHYIVLVREVTDLVEARRELESAMALNRQLVGEMNHRVKNNLAMVSSLIQLKERMLPDSTGLSDLRSQIDAIRFIHEHLQTSAGSTMIAARSYLERLVGEIATLAAGATVRPRVEADDASLPSRTATSLGLIVTELATNAIKHGLRETPSPELIVTLRKLHDRWLLQVTNNGSPIPDDVDFTTPRSFGLQLVTGLVSQLGGELEVVRGPTPAFTITFPAG